MAESARPRTAGRAAEAACCGVSSAPGVLGPGLASTWHSGLQSVETPYLKIEACWRVSGVAGERNLESRYSSSPSLVRKVAQ